VLIAGGTGSRTSIEAWDPATNTWSKVGDLQIGRYRHLSELLPDGRVIIMGGNGAEGILAKSEIFSIGIGPEVEAAVRTGTADAQLPTPVGSVEPTPEPTPDPDAVVIDVFDGPLEAPIDAVVGGDATQVPTGQPVRLHIGDLVISPGLSTGLGAEFIELVSDTRCAPGAVCDDPGQVEIVLLMRQLDFEFGTTTLILRGDQTLPSVKKIGKFSVALLAVDPVPAGDASDPIATLAIVEWRKPR
jgi:hypothetical protein